MASLTRPPTNHSALPSRPRAVSSPAVGQPPNVPEITFSPFTPSAERIVYGGEDFQPQRASVYSLQSGSESEVVLETEGPSRDEEEEGEYGVEDDDEDEVKAGTLGIGIARGGGEDLVGHSSRASSGVFPEEGDVV